MLSRQFLPFFLTLIFLSSCKSEKHFESKRSFYYWKTTFSLSPQEKAAIQNLKIQKLYLRFFDVDWDVATSTPRPLAKVSVRDAIPALKIVPVIYITNHTFLKLQKDQVKALAENTMTAISKLAVRNNIKYSEIQFDCDWTLQSREKYFSFLSLIRSKVPSHVGISATIRLHQIKYAHLTGIPPVNRGMLMFYNMGSLGVADKGNSIFNEKDARKYIKKIKSYSLPLDVALPVFSWVVQIRNNRIINLLVKRNTPDFLRDKRFLKKENCFEAKDSFYCKGFYIREGDRFRVERIEETDLTKAAEMVAEELRKNNRSVVLFDLDQDNLSNYENETLEEAFDSFN